MSQDIRQNYPIQNILVNEFYLDIYTLMHYMYENNIIITGSIIAYSVHQWDDFNSDLDIWVPPFDYEKKNQFHHILCMSGYCLTNIDYANPEDDTEFSKNIEMVAHYLKDFGNEIYRLIDVVYLKKEPENVLANTDLTLNMNYGKIFNIDNHLYVKIISINPNGKSDLLNKKLKINPQIIENIFLNSYEATKKKQRFLKYMNRGFEPEPVIKDTYLELLDRFITSNNIKKENNHGLSSELIELINELTTYSR